MKNRFILTLLTLCLILIPFIAFLYLHYEFNLLRFETDNEFLNRLIGGLLGLVVTLPGILFGYKFKAYGFGKK